jgi:hypothetical protein
MINLKTNQSVSGTNSKNGGLEKRLVATAVCMNEVRTYFLISINMRAHFLLSAYISRILRLKLLNRYE